MDTFQISSPSLTLTFDKDYGNLIGMRSAFYDWNVIARPHLGRNWELLIPLPDKRNNPVYGYKQKIKSLTLSPDGKRAQMHWEDVVSEFGGVHNVEVDIVVEVEGQAIVWRTKVTNHDGADRVVETISAPIVGDLKGIDNTQRLSTYTECYNGPISMGLYPEFNQNKGYWGIDIPTLVYDFVPPAHNPYLLIRSDDNAGIYFAPYDNIDMYMNWRFRLFPGYVDDSSIRVPQGDSIGGQEIYIPMDFIHAPFVANGETLEMTPLHIQGYQGDWTKGVDIYKQRRDEVWKLRSPHMPAWASEPHSWLQLQINSPEDELRTRFTELPKIAQECAEHGIKAIQLVGWNHGGQDRGNPSHDPDPRLGTFEELKEAIAQCHKIGVKIILFTKFTWADMTLDWYKEELYKYAVVDMHGIPYGHSGYQYQTTTQLLDFNTHRFATMCLLSDELRAIYLKEFQKVVDLGAAGMLYDECQQHGTAYLCFAENHGHRKGAYVYGADVKLMEEFRKIAPKDFLFAGEGCYDLEFQEYQLSYFRVNHRMNPTLKRYVRPRKNPLMMIAVTGFNARETLNRCLMCNYVISYEPFCFKGMPSDYPLTMEYGHQVEELREETRAYTWDGEFREQNGAKVYDKDGKLYPFYTVFRSNAGKLGVVITHFEGETGEYRVELETGCITRWKAVGGEWTQCNAIVIPMHTAVVAVEE